MSETKVAHTPEPWRQGRPGTVVADTKNEGMPMGAGDVDYYGGYLIGESMTIANARRVAACVNACEGIPGEALEGGVVREMVEFVDWIEGHLKVTDPEILERAMSIMDKVKPERVARRGGAS